MAELPDLAPADFAAWFHDLWGHTPFPWQQELVEQIHAEGRWPALVDLPTGTGKTSLIDIAVFLQALDAAQAPADRWMPRRIVSVVDRRIVVDQAADRARSIATKLAAAAAPPVIDAVATRLRHLAGTDAADAPAQDPPLLVATLRGAIARDESWMRRPDVPAVLSSTVDQAGSRLLFRGYGISRSMRPIHAGLLGNDVLWLLDEVHLARPFAQTLRQVRDLRAWRTGSELLPDRWGIVEMSATPSIEEDAALDRSGSARRVDDGDRFPARGIDPTSHPVIGRRLRASKPATLEAVKVTGDRVKADAVFAAACAEEARRLVNEGARTVGVIVNRVDTARRVRGELAEAGIEVELLTGRMRPVDRDRKVAALWSRLKTGRSRSTVELPLVLVATQCIEAGADFDLDAIVTEIAAFDALKQRFGRVDRDGQLSAADRHATSAILARSTDLKDDDVDPVYGTALRATWKWLDSLDTIDFGITRLGTPPVDVVARQRGAPLLLPTHLDQLCQTSTPISAEPDISRWLHGDADPSPDVQVIWRADVDEELIRREHRDPAEADRTSAALSERIGACPPAATEALTVSVTAVRQWLASAPVIEVSDVDGVSASSQEAPDRPMRPWITWSAGKAIPHVDDDGPEDERGGRRRRDRPRPGDVILVPTTYGGVSAGTWDPTALDAVEDVATEALHRQGRLDVLRLVPPLAPALIENPKVDLPDLSDLEPLSRSEQRHRVRAVLEAIDVEQLDEISGGVVARLQSAQDKDLRIVWPPGARWGTAPEGASAIVSRRAEPRQETSISTGPPTDTDASDEGSSFAGAPRGTLREHLHWVGRWAELLAGHLGLEPHLTEDLAAAGRFHDMGKHDRRFQVWLHGGDEVACAALGQALAKSRRAEPSAKRRRDSRRAAKYPLGARHELTSLPLVEDRVSQCHDPALVAHLVASHHGWCRAFAPPLIDDQPVTIDPGEGPVISSDHGMHGIAAGPPDAFWLLNQRYGWFQLAWLEAILRLSDHRQSEIEQQPEGSASPAGGAGR